jgi:hypothetical protein
LLVIVQELERCDPVLRELRRLSTAAGDVRAKRVHRAPEWKELSFSTGQNDEGRLYFKQAGETWLVLLSFKGSQERDLDYLVEH